MLMFGGYPQRGLACPLTWKLNSNKKWGGVAWSREAAAVELYVQTGLTIQGTVRVAVGIKV